MRKFIPLAFVALVAFGCKGGDSGSTAITPSSDGSYTLKFSPKEGQKDSYELNANVGPAKLTMAMTLACTKVDGDKYTIVTTIDDVKGTANGQDMPAAIVDSMKKVKATAVMDSTGKTLSTQVEGGAPGQVPDAGGMNFPAKPVKVGDTWEGVTKSNGAEVKAQYKLTKVEGNIATIESTLAGLPASITPDGPVVSQVDMTNGSLVSVTSKMTMKGQDGKENAMTVEMKKK